MRVELMEERLKFKYGGKLNEKIKICIYSSYFTMP